MAEIKVVSQGEGNYEVTVTEGSSRTQHQVSLSADSHRRLAQGSGASPERVITTSFEFLLEREPKESILSRFELTLIGHYFSGYEQVLARRLAQE